MEPSRDKIFRYTRRFKEVLQSLTLSDMALAVYAPEWGWGEDISSDLIYFLMVRITYFKQFLALQTCIFDY